MNPATNMTEVELLTTKYFSADAAERQYASNTLDAWCNQDNLFDSPLLNIFSESRNQYALLYASQMIVQWTKRHAAHIHEDLRQQVVERVGDALRRVALTTDSSTPPSNTLQDSFLIGNAPRAVIMALITCYAKLLKLGFENEPYLPAGVQSAEQMITMATSDGEYHLGLMLLEGVVSQFSSFDSSKTHGFMDFTSHRRCSNNFRDQMLLSIFMTALNAMKRLMQQAEEADAQGGSPVMLSPQHPHLKEIVLLLQRCLSFDFMAILVDETEEAMSSQFPATWRETLLRDDTMLLLWRSLGIIPLPYCTIMMKGLSSLCGIRRTFFETPEDRQQYLSRIFAMFMEMLMQRMDNRLVLSPGFLNEVADCCVRLVSPFGYRDLHLSNMFFPWLTSVKDLTLEVLSRPIDGGGIGISLEEDERVVRQDIHNDGSHRDFSGPAMTFMNFWGKLASSFRMYNSGREDQNELASSSMMEDFVMEIVLRFFQTRVTPNGAPISEETNTLTDAIVSQCDNCTLLCLVNPSLMLSRLAEYLNQQVSVQGLCSSSPSGMMWLCYCAGSFVRTILSNVEDSSVYGEAFFFRFVVECVAYRSQMFHSIADPRCANDVASLFGSIVELAVLHFLNYVQIILCTDRMHTALQAAVVEIFQSPQMLFQFLLTHTGDNIMRSVDNSVDENVVTIMKMSMDLIAEACNHMMQSSSQQDIRFDIPSAVDLPLSNSIRTYRLRTNLYHMLWPLRMPTRYQTKAFLDFLGPIDHCIHQTLSGNATHPCYVAGWLRDLRGVARGALEHQESKVDFISWFCDRAPMLHNILNGPCGDSPIVIISFLRFASELISSRHGHNGMDRSSHSANGLLVFKILCNFIQQIVERCITDEKIQVIVQGGPVDGIYEVMLKPLSLCMGLLRICVCENFVPFGAMWFYQDETYDNTLLGLLRMVGVFSTDIFKQYSKVSTEILRLLRGIGEEQTYHPVVKLNTGEVETILNFVISRCEDVEIQTGALLHGMSFLSFIADMIREVKELSSNPNPEAAAGSSGLPSPIMGSTPPRTPIPSSYYVMGPDGQSLSLSSGTPGGRNQTRVTGSVRSLRHVRLGLARLLEPIPGLWTALIRVAMNIIVTQDRAISVSCSVVFPIFEAHPPFWYEFVEGFVGSYPSIKQAAVRDALAALSNAGTTSEAFFSEVFSFRQKMRSL